MYVVVKKNSLKGNNSFICMYNVLLFRNQHVTTKSSRFCLFLLFGLQKADTTKTRGKPVLDAEEFVKFYHMLTERPEIDEIFMKYDDGKGFWTFTDLCKFFYHEQKVQEYQLSFISTLIPLLSLSMALVKINFELHLKQTDLDLFCRS